MLFVSLLLWPSDPPSRVRLRVRVRVRVRVSVPDPPIRFWSY